ncbi:MAG: hypothetical protein JO001_16940 [Alphaproteobacteria bacterium]|nr:hypothetical protein [Alphaproteobacteria bacterium]
MMAIPIIIVVTFPLTDIPKSVRDAFRFQIHKGRYEIEVAKAREAGRHFTVVDDWSVFATANFFVVWDDADKPEEVMSGFTPQRHFGDHFYLVGETQ